MSDHGDRRKEARKLVVVFTLVYDSGQGKLLGYLRDLTDTEFLANYYKVIGNHFLATRRPKKALSMYSSLVQPVKAWDVPGIHPGTPAPQPTSL